MDTQAVNSVGNPMTPKPKPINSSSSLVAENSLSTNVDKVDLSKEAQSLFRRDSASANTTNSANGKQKKLSISDNNDIVIEIRDPQTQEVVRTVPSKEQLELKKAIQNELDKI